jgi:sn-glycerol 3-phosphate transport system permease protein
MTAVSKREHKAAWKMTPGKFLLYAFMYIFAIICLIPLVWLVRTAFVPKELELDMLAVGWVPTFSNITRIWGMAMWGNYYINTLIVVAGVLGAQFVTITMAGYAFARLNFYGKNVLFILFLTQIMIAADGLILPNYVTISRMGLNDTLFGAMLPFFASAMGTFLMRQTIKTIPYELEEAARIDGAGERTIFFSVKLPLCISLICRILRPLKADGKFLNESFTVLTL